MKVWTPRNTLIMAGVAVGLAWYMKSRAGAAFSAVTTAVNPTDHDNLANRGFNGLYRSITGSTGTLGTDMAKNVETLEPGHQPEQDMDFSKLLWWRND